jgi:endonuclease III related protein
MIPSRGERLTRIFDRLFQAFGPQHWWPAESPFEVIVGAILTQNTAWKNVEKSIGKLREHGLLSLEGLHRITQEELAAIIRSSGYYNQKSKKLKAFCHHLRSHWAGEIERLLAQDMEPLRDELLGLHGIGPETADSIVLYAAQKSSFVVDVYTHRVFSRHGWVEETMGYDDLRAYFMDALDPDVALFQEYHALLVRVGHLHCRRRPVCSACPLNQWEP